MELTQKKFLINRGQFACTSAITFVLSDSEKKVDKMAVTMLA